jgi:hypothetical protein
LKSDGTNLTDDELLKLSTFMDSVKTSQAHIVYKNAKKLYIQALVDIKRNPKLSISDSELYDLLKTFLIDYNCIKTGTCHSTKIIAQSSQQAETNFYNNHNQAEYKVVRTTWVPV